LGYRERIVLGASGRAILAFSGIPRKDLAQYASDIPISFDEFLKGLDETRERGYAVSRDELIDGAICIAAPFFSRPDQIGGSFAVFGPSARLNEQRIEDIGKLLMQQADALSKLLCGVSANTPHT